MQMTESAKDHKVKQDDQLRRNTGFRNQLIQLRRQMVEAQRLQLEENANFEERLSQQCQRIHAATQEGL
jgi:hypothetical protein